MKKIIQRVLCVFGKHNWKTIERVKFDTQVITLRVCRCCKMGETSTTFNTPIVIEPYSTVCIPIEGMKK